MVRSIRLIGTGVGGAILVALVGCGGGSGGGQTATTPHLSLTASPTGVPRGGSTTLSWTSASATACTASGGWSGAKALSGSETTAPLNTDQTYQLACTGPTGNTLSMTTVTVRAAIISWTVPTENSDGSPLTDLVGFKVRWGSAPHQYSSSVDVSGATTDTYETQLSPGTWYFSVSAVNASGQESAPSNEVDRMVL